MMAPTPPSPDDDNVSSRAVEPYLATLLDSLQDGVYQPDKFTALELDDLKLFGTKLLPEHAQRTLLNVSLHAVVAFAGLAQLSLQLSRILRQAFLVRLELHSLFLELLLDVHDLLLFTRQLTADLHDFALELLFELNDPFFSSLQIGGFLANFALK